MSCWQHCFVTKEGEVISVVGRSTSPAEFSLVIKKSSQTQLYFRLRATLSYHDLLSGVASKKADCWGDRPARQHLGWPESHAPPNTHTHTHTHKHTTRNLEMSAELNSSHTKTYWADTATLFKRSAPLWVSNECFSAVLILIRSLLQIKPSFPSWSWCKLSEGSLLGLATAWGKAWG